MLCYIFKYYIQLFKYTIIRLIFCFLGSTVIEDFKFVIINKDNFFIL